MTATELRLRYRTRLQAAQARRPGSRDPGRCVFVAVSVDEAERHHEANVFPGSGPILGKDGRGPFGGLEGEAHLVARHVAKDLEQVAAVETDVERIAGVLHRNLVLAFTDVRRLHGELEQRGVEGQLDAMRLV